MNNSITTLLANAVIHCRLALYVLFALSMMPAKAEDSDFIDRTFLGELPVVLSASRLSQPGRDTPGAITVIDRVMIRASGARSVADLLLLVPGFQLGAVKLVTRTASEARSLTLRIDEGEYGLQERDTGIPGLADDSRQQRANLCA